MLHHVIGFVISYLLLRPCRSRQFELEELMRKMERDVLDLAAHIETIYHQRCSDETLHRCPKNNYDNCIAAFPSQTCPGGEQLNIAACGDGMRCGGLFDYTTTNVRLPRSTATGVDGNPTNKQVIETVCYTRQAEDWFLEKYARDMTFWNEYGVVSPPMYFGAIDGTFRIFPARQSSSCNTYDPRKRPWYIAGSSGPKDIVLILDTSQSMSTMFHLMQEAAITIVETLTVGDRVAIVRFGNDASIVAGGSGRRLLLPATLENKRKLIDAINGFSPLGKTNFYDAFDIAFGAMEDTVDLELHSGCNSAILFFTDGEMTRPVGITERQLMDLIKMRKTAVERTTKHPLTIFTYSIGDEAVHVLPKRIACETNGLWSQIDNEQTLTESMSAYYRVFALGLGVDRNADFLAWVEPYRYATGNILGTTVSAPVYDTNFTPPLFLGVVGFDFTLAAIDRALGVEAGSTETLQAVVRRSTAKCPKLVLKPCELESLRRRAGGNEALCTNNCTELDFVGIEPEQCPAVSDYPTYLWQNTQNKGKSYLDRVCCKVGETSPSNECPEGGFTVKAKSSSQEDKKHGLSTGAITGIALGSAAAVGTILFVCCCVVNNRRVGWKTPKQQIALPNADGNFNYADVHGTVEATAEGTPEDHNQRECRETTNIEMCTR